MSKLEEQAKKLLEKNTRVIKRGKHIYRFSVPSGTVYPFQWFWDSCFHAIVWAKLGEYKRAKEELQALVLWQKGDGFIPHVIFWDRKHGSRSWRSWHKLQSKGYLTWLNPLAKAKITAEIQPPIIAQAVEKIWEQDKDITFVHKMLFPLYRYYKNLLETRSVHKDGLISIICQYESGIDYSPAYDSAIAYDSDKNKPADKVRRITFLNKLFNYNLKLIFTFGRFQTKDVLVNSVFIQGLFSLVHLAGLCSNIEIEKWAREQAQVALKSLTSKCYDKESGLFWNLDGKKQTPSKVKTILSLMPLIIKELPREIADKMVIDHLINGDEFLTPHMIPSVAKNEKTFNPKSNDKDRSGIWRGPLSMNTNWFLVDGLRQHGYGDLADQIARKSKKLVEQYGFNEFYNPLTGEPVGANEFGWATLVIDM